MNADYEAENKRLRHLLFQVALAATNPDRDHVDRCVDVMGIVGSAEEWRQTSLALRDAGVMIEQAEKEAREGTWGDASDLRRTEDYPPPPPYRGPPQTDEERAEWARRNSEREATLSDLERVTRYGLCPLGHRGLRVVYYWRPGEVGMELACQDCDQFDGALRHD